MTFQEASRRAFVLLGLRAKSDGGGAMTWQCRIECRACAYRGDVAAAAWRRLLRSIPYDHMQEGQS